MKSFLPDTLDTTLLLGGTLLIFILGFIIGLGFAPNCSSNPYTTAQKVDLST